MRSVKRTIAIVFVLFLLASCKKDKETLPVFATTGYWLGDISADGAIETKSNPGENNKLYHNTVIASPEFSKENNTSTQQPVSGKTLCIASGYLAKNLINYPINFTTHFSFGIIIQ